MVTGADVQLELAAAVVVAALLSVAFAGDSKRHLASLYQWVKGQMSGKNKLPDYSKLTGFPAPKPIHHFDIDIAEPRPYRPFRWEYYQTMCELSYRCNWRRVEYPWSS